MRRALALFLLLPAAAVVGGSCRDVISPEPISLVASLCDLLAQCEGRDAWSCPSAVQTPFDELEEEARINAYARFLGANCLEDCRSARSCRDLEPLCGMPGSACGGDSACCGYTDGIAECRGLEEGSCCRPDGAPCKGDDECCEGGCNNEHCGDFACTLTGQQCDTHFECCTTRCDFDVEPSVCAPNTCSIVGELCNVSDDCCDEAATCEPGDLPGQRICKTASCDAGCDPFDSDNCCVTGGLGVCFLLLSEETVCGDTLCPPAGVECGGDDDCRCLSQNADDLICDDAAFPHCATCRGAGATCDPSLEDDLCCVGTACQLTTSTCQP